MIDFEEFKALLSLLCERISKRVATEALFCYVVGPVVAMIAIWTLDHFIYAPSFVPKVLFNWILPLRNAIFISVFLSTVVPKMIAIVAPSGQPVEEKKAE